MLRAGPGASRNKRVQELRQHHDFKRNAAFRLRSAALDHAGICGNRAMPIQEMEPKATSAVRCPAALPFRPLTTSS